MRPAIDPHADEWINGSQARRLLGCAPTTLQRAVIFGEVEIRLSPGVPPRYRRVDCERLAARLAQAKAKAEPVGA